MKGHIRLLAVVASLTLALGVQVPASAGASQTLVIGVDHLDSANQNPPAGRYFEYTDFFSRNVTVHANDTLDFRAAPGSFHVVALAPDEQEARAAYPLGIPDREDPNAPGSGKPKIVAGPANFSITGGSTDGGGTIGGFGPPPCGFTGFGQPPCNFSGGDDVESNGGLSGFNPFTGQPEFVDWSIHIDSNAPLGRYAYFCFIHPGMRGAFTVVGPHKATTSQADIVRASEPQFQNDRAQALAAERAANVVRFRGGDPGERTYQVSVGIAAAHNHVAIDEMLPTAPLSLQQGDLVQYNWPDPHNVHTVGFPAGDPRLPSPFGFDCDGGYVSLPPGPPPPPCNETGEPVELMFDPGNAASGSELGNPSRIVDAGVLLGTDFRLPSIQRWIVSTGDSAPGTYRYQCTIHDWMRNAITIGDQGNADTGTAGSHLNRQSGGWKHGLVSERG